MTERRSTGNARLDDVLGGGVLRNSIVVIAGAPGTGKTMLAEQFVFANADRAGPALYLSTSSEPLDKLLRFGQELSFFDPAEVGHGVIYDELWSAIDADGLAGVAERIEALIDEHEPSVLAIDSFKPLATLAGAADYRRFLHRLAGRLTSRPITSLWVGEYLASEATDTPEFAIADGVINLESVRTFERTTRYLTVFKLRGSDFASGSHAYRLSSDGLVLFPRMAERDRAQVDHPDASGGRMSTGIAALDDSIAHGYWPGSTTLVAGPSGSGKTIMGLHFLYAGAARGERGLLVNLQETRAQLARLVASFGWTLDDRVEVMTVSPIDLLVDELAHRILEATQERSIRRVVIDSVVDLEAASPDRMRFRELLVTLVRRLQGRGISTLFTLEMADLFKVSRLSDRGISHLADNVVLLQHVPDGWEMKRSLTVLKTRGSSHDPTIRELLIGADGLTLGEPITLAGRS